MAKHNKWKKTLFFLEGATATEAEIAASMEFEPGVNFRNASLTRKDEAIESFDRVAGAVPDRYQAAADAKAGKARPAPGADADAAPAAASGASPLPPGAPAAPTPNGGAGWSRNS